MRVISGKFKGRKFHPPQNLPTRPTTDFAKEGLFNIIANHFDLEEVAYLDLFCGTGSLSYEFASRDCVDITCVDQYHGCIKFVNKMIDQLGIEGMSTVQQEVFQFISLSTRQYDIIFAGPPYRMEEISKLPDSVIDNNLLTPEGWFILEHNPFVDLSEHPNLFHQRNYGKTIFSLFSTSSSNEV
jgi:16S rRNA (guanine(966)-N(2))-methyltransferase RsmD